MQHQVGAKEQAIASRTPGRWQSHYRILSKPCSWLSPSSFDELGQLSPGWKKIKDGDPVFTVRRRFGSKTRGTCAHVWARCDRPHGRYDEQPNVCLTSASPEETLRGVDDSRWFRIACVIEKDDFRAGSMNTLKRTSLLGSFEPCEPPSQTIQGTKAICVCRCESTVAFLSFCGNEAVDVSDVFLNSTISCRRLIVFQPPCEGVL